MMDKVKVNGKEYKVVKEYPYVVHCIDKNGVSTCFTHYDLGMLPQYAVDRKPYRG